jgi:hypothetical protein
MSEQFLSRLYYASTVTDDYSPMEIGNILEACRQNNPPVDVTGMLFLGNGFFFQCLEGPRANVNYIYHQIANDSRHKDVQILEFKEVGRRLFSEWSMKYVKSASVVDKILKETGVRTFNPYELDSYMLNMIAEAFSNYHEPENAPMEHQGGVKQKKSSGFFGFLKK